MKLYKNRIQMKDEDMDLIYELIDLYERVYDVHLSQRKAVLNAVTTLSTRLEAELEDES